MIDAAALDIFLGKTRVGTIARLDGDASIFTFDEVYLADQNPMDHDNDGGVDWYELLRCLQRLSAADAESSIDGGKALTGETMAPRAKAAPAHS